MIDRLWNRFKGSQPWRVSLAEGVIEEARAAIQALHPDGPDRKQALLRLDRFLGALETDPLRVLGHPPLGTDDPDVFRYSADPQLALSVVADLDLERRELVVVMIKIKGARHGSH